MIMAEEEEGEDLRRFQKELVQKGELPRAYVITEERFKAGRRLSIVKVQDETGIIPLPDSGIRAEKL